MNRQQLRQQHRQSRRDFNQALRATAERNICQHVQKLIDRIQPRVYCAYLAVDGEVDLALLIKQTATPLGLPRVDEDMTFHRWSPGEALAENRFAISEPVAGASLIETETIDLLLLPLVAYDEIGNRLGMGGGYYDKFIAAMPTRPYCAGVAFRIQQTSQLLPAEPWDQPLDAVVTENGVLEFPSTSTQ